MNNEELKNLRSLRDEVQKLGRRIDSLVATDLIRNGLGLTPDEKKLLKNGDNKVKVIKSFYDRYKDYQPRISILEAKALVELYMDQEEVY